MPETDAPLINEQADRQLGRLILRYGLLTLVVLTVVSLVMTPVNAPFGAFYRLHRWRDVVRVLALDFLGVLVILIPFFLGISRVFAARLRLGREFVAQRRWGEAIAALDPFAGAGQRFLDGTGEAHALLAQAYAGAGDRVKADKARTFVLRHRRGPWADKLTAPPVPRAGSARPSDKRPTPQPPGPVAAGQEKRPRPSNKGRRKRF